ncbi:ParB/RepB/Spo0J family partition protein [Dialister sp.]|uniref:ParB/RepB/Spo0J family partition protein n=1 Tax=Dialister sp. TaxID=1955814 RepID=UPI002E8211E8|nr:ParB/RepB/Spo0J family partition protein [Dialister sp.]MEE3453904.1 ParB/RepB/Spo0J family partition protein [Dialister sp.]
MTKKKLGRGLGELFGDDLDESGKVLDISTDAISGNPWQPRQDFDEESLKSLAESIKKDGLLSPVVVRKKEDNRYELIAGERRYRAAKLAGLLLIPAIVVDYDDRKAAEMALVENLQREDLNPVEEGLAYQKLMETYGLTQEEVADKVGRSRPYVANLVRLLELPEEIKNFLIKKELTPGQARPLLTLPSEAEKVSLARRIVREGLSARAVEELIRGKKPAKPKKEIQISGYVKELQDKLGLSVGSPVAIHFGRGRNAHKGTISISFKNDEEFQRIMDILNQEH